MLRSPRWEALLRAFLLCVHICAFREELSPRVGFAEGPMIRESRYDSRSIKNIEDIYMLFSVGESRRSSCLLSSTHINRGLEAQILTRKQNKVQVQWIVDELEITGA